MDQREIKTEHRITYFPPGEPTKTRKVTSLAEAIDLCTDPEQLATFAPILEERTIIVSPWVTVRNFAADKES